MPRAHFICTGGRAAKRVLGLEVLRLENKMRNWNKLVAKRQDAHCPKHRTIGTGDSKLWYCAGFRRLFGVIHSNAKNPGKRPENILNLEKFGGLVPTQVQAKPFSFQKKRSRHYPKRKVVVPLHFLETKN